jgi:hypothetical protein
MNARAAPRATSASGSSRTSSTSSAFCAGRARATATSSSGWRRRLNEGVSAPCVPRLCRGRGASPRRLLRGPPPRSSPATTWRTILTIPSATRRTTPGAAAGANPCRQSTSPTTSSPPSRWRSGASSRKAHEEVTPEGVLGGAQTPRAQWPRPSSTGDRANGQPTIARPCLRKFLRRPRPRKTWTGPTPSNPHRVTTGGAATAAVIDVRSSTESCYAAWERINTLVS